ncbi:MAG TPA: hypothetical protein VLM76_04285 [Patescibacteria group bacterium]|nr:hypothetical protein [Patescibacteria group bacterium]
MDPPERCARTRLRGRLAQPALVGMQQAVLDERVAVDLGPKRAHHDA